MGLIEVLAEAATAPKAPNLWGALGCALAYSGALFATIDSFADILLASGDAPGGRLSPALRLKTGSKLAAAGITVVAAGLVLALDRNWFAFIALSAAFVVLAGIAALVLVRHRAMRAVQRAESQRVESQQTAAQRAARQGAAPPRADNG
ncbi:hypothetical protein ET445_14795 [Agromyces protaetiae]|uniref:Uncharacterized protein n=1 Tax=Agromyces protaetiae TaxID=2509455 RepID=A0A4P6FEP5_9MICO|nr:hypothetical protein [Agromyces protaetiae]QAY74404.1 hypothetical protein ET445_14795 [Agromyces protaetiae]